MRRPTLSLAAMLLAVAIVVPSVRSSGATFTASTKNPTNLFTTAATFNTVTASLTAPPTYLRGSVAFSATASSNYAITSVVVQIAPTGTSTWTTACTATFSPYTCSYDTTAKTDAIYDLRAVATDALGYTATTATVSRRIDNTAPTATLTSPGTPLVGTKALTGTAADGGSGVAQFTIDYRLTGGSTWTTICSRTVSPWSCSWATAAIADGAYDLRATTTDNAGNVTASTVATTRVDNTAPTVTQTDPGSPLRGSVTLASTAADGTGTGLASIRYQYKTSAGATWVDACTATTAPWTCTWSTAALADGLYDVHAIATDGAAFSTTSASVTSRRVDNTAPSSVKLDDPGSPLGDDVDLTASAADAGSGVASVTFERAAAGGSTWTPICTATVTPYSCTWSTTAVANGSYDLHAVATDAAGNTLTSTKVASRTVTNGGAFYLSDPGAYLRGTEVLRAVPPASATYTGVAVQRAAAGGSTWTTICTDTTRPYTCSWDTTAVADGSFDLRAVATASGGATTTSAVLSGRKVDNTAPTGVDVQTVNGGTAAQIDTGDKVVFTYSERMDSTSILAGWSGGSTAITVSILNNGTRDTLAVLDSTGTTRVALLDASTDVLLNNQHVNGGGATFAATMSQSNAVITVTLGALTNGSTRSAVAAGPAIEWTPSATSTDLAGNALTGGKVTESGTSHAEF